MVAWTQSVAKVAGNLLISIASFLLKRSGNPEVGYEATMNYDKLLAY